MISGLHKSWEKKKNQFRKSPFTFTQFAFRDHANIHCPSNFHLSSIYGPSLQQLCLPNDDFPFFIPSVFINLDASVSNFSVSSAFFITVKEKSYYGREPLLLKFAVCFWWGLMVYISLDSWRSSIIEIGTQSRSDWMVSGDRTRSNNLLCGWQACYGTHRGLISIYRWYLTSRH